ncbi:MAG: M48 family metalloprotease [Woeseiaceae bacterium]|jgi:beta-barrel assembly-enhancing protease|nr:M48 family metallopeptidase [Gammaproteobacteria bacterium]MDG2108132.1 M48 family metalloprotease [Woeseiaceae bacterium]
MINKSLTIMLLAVISCSLVFVSGAGADDIQLPDLGSPADTVLSQNDEAQIGSAIMRDIRNSGQVVEDPLVTEYINQIGNKIAAQTNNGDYDFTFFVIKDSRINAFALPGGYIGIHTGLLEATRSEDELAGVLAHEVAHVTQRHIARAIHASSKQSILSTAIMLGAVLAGAASGSSDVMQAGMAVAQGTAMQQQINFTRSNEHEADRIGISALAGAGFDPYGMASFFNVLSRQTTRAPNERIPEFLMTHPVTSSRIAEARDRARSFEQVKSDNSISYGISKIRTTVDRFKTSQEAVTYFERRAYQNQNDLERYGRLLAYMRNGRLEEAQNIVDYLMDKHPDVIAYHIALGDILVLLRQNGDAIAVFEDAIRLFPRNVPLVIAFAKRLLELNQAEKSHDLLLDLLNNVPPTPDQIRLIARAASEAGKNAESLYYLSEYRLMIGDLIGGIAHLQQALRLPQLQEIQRIRFEARIDFIREFMTEEQLRRMQRRQPSGRSVRNSR